jgi:hypothetical protein
MAGCLEHNNTKDLCPYDVINVKARHMQVDLDLNFCNRVGNSASVGGVDCSLSTKHKLLCDE